MFFITDLDRFSRFSGVAIAFNRQHLGGKYGLFSTCSLRCLSMCSPQGVYLVRFLACSWCSFNRVLSSRWLSLTYSSRKNWLEACIRRSHFACHNRSLWLQLGKRGNRRVVYLVFSFPDSLVPRIYPGWDKFGQKGRSDQSIFQCCSLVISYPNAKPALSDCSSESIIIVIIEAKVHWLQHKRNFFFDVSTLYSPSSGKCIST